MQEPEAGRFIIRLSYILAAVAAVTVALLAANYERQSREVYRQTTRSDALDELSLVRSELQGAIEANIQLVQGLVGVVEYEPNLGPEQFEMLGARIIRGREDIRAIAAAPGLVVRMIYPKAGNESVLGLDYLKDPAQRQAALMARALGTTVLAGPVQLVQGGVGFIARTPVFIDSEEFGRRFWGIVSTVIDRDAFYRRAGLSDPSLPVDVLLVGRDGLVANGEPFYGDPAILDQDPVTARVELPYGAWALSAVPKGGWPEQRGVMLQRALFGFAGLLLVAPILGAARLVASRQTQFAVIRDRETELSRLSWRLEFALAASNVGVWDVDLATDVLIWDDRVKELFGVAGRQGPFREADWIGMLHPEDRARAMAEAESAVAGKGKFVSMYRIIRPDGAVRHIRDIAALYVGDDGSRRLVGLLWDVTEDVERQEELDLRRREAEAATVAKSRFLAAMSHEIRTPMSGVLGLLGLMLDEQLSVRQRERATIALASAQSLLEILNDILDFSKLEASQIRLSEDRVAVRPLVGEVIELMGAGAAQKEIRLLSSISDAVPPFVATDAMRFRQVLTNLVSNATKFTDDGEVMVRVGYDPLTSGGTLHVEVQDTGIGIDEAQHEQIFQHFVQADNSLTRRAGGTGLGLAISKQLVELMGGTIGVRSVPGMGSTFAFTIVARPAQGDVVEAPAVRVPEGDAVEPLRVLLAEDNATNQYLMNAYLRGAGHAVEVVSNGTDAITAAATGRFDVVLMDLQMPEIDGLAATRAIRALPQPAGAVPVIALTANAMPQDRDACYAAGMTDYLSKPIDVSALHRVLSLVRPRDDEDATPPPPRRSAASR